MSLIVLAFKYSNKKSLKKSFVITILILLLTGIFYVAGRLINPLIGGNDWVVEKIENATFFVRGNWDKDV